MEGKRVTLPRTSLIIRIVTNGMAWQLRPSWIVRTDGQLQLNQCRDLAQMMQKLFATNSRARHYLTGCCETAGL